MIDQSPQTAPTPPPPKQDPPDIDSFIESRRSYYGIPKNLVHALTNTESGGEQTNASGGVKTSSQGARGRFQVLPGTAKQYSLNPDNEYENAEAGLRYLSDLHKKVHPDIKDPGERWAATISGYHSGEGGLNEVNKTGNLPNRRDANMSTSDYTRRVFDRWRQLDMSESGQPQTQQPQQPQPATRRERVTALQQQLQGPAQPGSAGAFGSRIQPPNPVAQRTNDLLNFREDPNQMQARQAAALDQKISPEVRQQVRGQDAYGVRPMANMMAGINPILGPDKPMSPQEEAALNARRQVAEEARQQIAAQNPGKLSRAVMGAGSVPAHALAGVASIPRRIMGSAPGPIETGLGGIGDVLAAGAQPTPEQTGTFSAGNLGTVAGFIPTMAVGGRVLGPITPAGPAGAAISSGAQFGNIAAGQGVSNQEALRQGAIGGAAGAGAGVAEQMAARRIAQSALSPVAKLAAQKAAQAAGGGAAFAGQSAAMGQRDPATLAKEGLLGAAMGVAHPTGAGLEANPVQTRLREMNPRSADSVPNAPSSDSANLSEMSVDDLIASLRDSSDKKVQPAAEPMGQTAQSKQQEPFSDQELATAAFEARKQAMAAEATGDYAGAAEHHRRFGQTLDEMKAQSAKAGNQEEVAAIEQAQTAAKQKEQAALSRVGRAGAPTEPVPPASAAKAEVSGDAWFNSLTPKQKDILESHWQGLKPSQIQRQVKGAGYGEITSIIDEYQNRQQASQPQGEQNQRSAMEQIRTGDQSAIRNPQSAIETAPTRDLITTLPASGEATPRITRQLPQIKAERLPAVEAPITQEPTNRITEGIGDELPRRVSRPLEGQPTEIPQKATETPATLRESVAKGEYGKLSEAARSRATENKSLAGHLELRKLLGLEEMPPYNHPETGKTAEWGAAAQETMNELAKVAGHGKQRSSEMGIEGLRDAYRNLQAKAKQQGTKISPDLTDAFRHTAARYQEFRDPYMALHEGPQRANYPEGREGNAKYAEIQAAHEKAANVYQEIEDTYAKRQELTREQHQRLRNTLRSAFDTVGIKQHFIDNTLWPQALETARSLSRAEAEANPRRSGPDVSGRAGERAPAPESANPAVNNNAVANVEAKSQATDTEFAAQERLRIDRQHAYQEWLDTPDYNKVAGEIEQTPKGKRLLAKIEKWEGDDPARETYVLDALIANESRKRGIDVPKRTLEYLGIQPIGDETPTKPVARMAERPARASDDNAVAGKEKLETEKTAQERAPLATAERRANPEAGAKVGAKEEAQNDQNPAANDKTVRPTERTLAEKLAEVDTMERDDLISKKSADEQRALLRAKEKKQRPVATSEKESAFDTLAREMVKQEPHAATGALTSLADLRTAMKDQFPTKEGFDQFILEQAKAEKITLSRHDYPAKLSAAEKAAMIPDGKGGYFMGAALLNDYTPKFVAEQQKILDEYKSGTRSGSGGEQLFAQAVVTGHKIYKAGMEFKDWARDVIKEAGEAVRPHLRAAWQKVKEAQSFGELPKTRADVENSPRFKRWFGESKVTENGEANGKPMVVYHGTQSSFKDNTFRESDGILGRGTYFTSDATNADTYARRFGRTEGGNVIPVYLSIKKPYIFEYKNADEKFGISNQFSTEKLNNLKSQGYDGVILKSPDGTFEEISAFSPNQIKSATGNSGAFSSETGSILGSGFGVFQDMLKANSESLRSKPEDTKAVGEEESPRAARPSRAAKPQMSAQEYLDAVLSKPPLARRSEGQRAEASARIALRKVAEQMRAGVFEADEHQGIVNAAGKVLKAARSGDASQITAARERLKAIQPRKERETKSAEDYFQEQIAKSPLDPKKDRLGARAQAAAIKAVRDVGDAYKLGKMDDARANQIKVAADGVLQAVKLGDPDAIRDAQKKMGRAQEATSGRVGRRLRQAARIGLHPVSSIQTAVFGTDFSFVGKQAAPLTFNPRNIVSTATAFKNLWTAAKTEKGAAYIKQQLESHPRFDLAGRAGLEMALTSHPEEIYKDNIVAKLPWVKRMEAGNEAFIDYMRLQEFGKYADAVDASGRTEAQKADAYKRSAAIVNDLTGRTALGEGRIKAIVEATNGYVASPRLNISHIKLLDPTRIVREWRRNPEVGRQMAKDAVTTAGLMAGMMALGKMTGVWDVGLDPDDSDFLKFKIGNTRYDPGFGELPLVRMAWKMGKLAYNMGVDVKEGSGQSERDLKASAKDSVRALGTWAEGRLGPLPAYTWNLVTGKDFIGRPVKLQQFGEPTNPNSPYRRLIVPASVGNIGSSVMTAREKGLGEAAKEFIKTVPTEMVGIGTNTFEKGAKVVPTRKRRGGKGDLFAP